MRAVIQRVNRASVTIKENIFSEIGKGLLVLLGIEETDTPEDAEWLSAKTAKLRIFSDSNGSMNLPVADVCGGLLVVSQFTLHASTKKGNRPSFAKAAKPEPAAKLYEEFVNLLTRDSGFEVKTGVFGADMLVSLENDGPVTIIIDSKLRE